MDPERLEGYATQLTALKSELQSEIDQSAAESSPVQLDGTMGRISRMDAMQVQQLALEVKRQRLERLKQVDGAFLRVKKGRFGLCARCNNPISFPRLDAVPDTVFCLPCTPSSR